MTNANDELSDFQKKVFAEYETARSLKKSSNRIKEDRENNKKGCLAVPMLIFADLVIKKAVKSTDREKNYAGNAREAGELLRQREISDEICKMINEVNRREILTEEKFVNDLTAALYRSNLAKRFVIPENAVLYAMMAMEVFNIGIENFCNARQGDV